VSFYTLRFIYGDVGKHLPITLKKTKRMKKYFLIPQPPITEKIIFLVDKLDKNSTFGFTEDLDKIEYNLNLIGTDFKENLEIAMSLNDNGITKVIDLGMFISILELKKDKSEQRMCFFDIRSKSSITEKLAIIEDMYNIDISEKFNNTYDLIMSESSPDLDSVELLIPEEL